MCSERQRSFEPWSSSQHATLLPVFVHHFPLENLGSWVEYWKKSKSREGGHIGNSFLKFYYYQLVACQLLRDAVVIIFTPKWQKLSSGMISMDGEGEDHKYLKETARKSAQRTKSKLHLRVKKTMSAEDANHTGLGYVPRTWVTKGMGNLPQGMEKNWRLPKTVNITLPRTASSGSGEENNLNVVEENRDHPYAE